MDVQTLARPEAKDGQGGSITLPVAGMTCASCVGSVEKAVGKVPGVRTVSVNLATGRAEIEFENAVDVAGVVGAIERAGYEVPENQVELAVEGMTCGSCVRRRLNASAWWASLSARKSSHRTRMMLWL